MKSSNGLHPVADNDLLKWRDTQKDALALIKMAGDLKYDRSIDLVLFRKEIFDLRPSELAALHFVSEDFDIGALKIEQSLKIANIVLSMSDLPACKIDLGRLSMEFNADSAQSDLNAFIHNKIGFILEKDSAYLEPKDVVLYGFGRIGRLLARKLIEQTGMGNQMRLRAIVLRKKLSDSHKELQKRAALLRDDSVHGQFNGVIELDLENDALIVNGSNIKIIYANGPADIDYRDYGINNALLIDNTGKWRDKEGLSEHLRPGIEKVLLTAPGKGVPNVVYGVNHGNEEVVNADILSAASCTTNAIVPIIYALKQKWEILQGHIETIHAYTSDQNLLDNFHNKERRGRAAAINMVITTTGAAAAVAKVIPDLEGKLTGNAVRVPTPDVSLAIINLDLDKATSIEEINNHLKNYSLKSDLYEQIHYSTDTEFVSSHAIGTTTTSVVDAPSTIISKDGKKVTLYAWYDNEYGYACQVVRLAKKIANVRRYTYY